MNVRTDNFLDLTFMLTTQEYDKVLELFRSTIPPCRDRSVILIRLHPTLRGMFLLLSLSLRDIKWQEGNISTKVKDLLLPHAASKID